MPFLMILLITCNKNKNPVTDVSYNTIEDFFLKNNIALQTYTIDGINGGNFITPQGTSVTIPPGAFVTSSNNPVTGTVTIQFKDLYKKSDMLLSNMHTMLGTGEPLKSGGEFFIKVTVNNNPVVLANGKKITVAQPILLTGDSLDKMQPFQLRADSVIDSVTKQLKFINNGWKSSVLDSAYKVADLYIYKLYQFKAPADSGTWCNSDNSSYFASFTQTKITMVKQDNISNNNTQVFLIFKDITCMVHVYGNGSNFPYNYAPAGLKCNLVAVGTKDGNLYSAILPITILPNMTVNFAMTKITTEDFLSQIKILN